MSLPCMLVRGVSSGTYILFSRWAGVPFILKAGKALNERKVEIRVQMRPTVANLWQEENPEALRNELVVSHLHAIAATLNHLRGGWLS